MPGERIPKSKAILEIFYSIISTFLLHGSPRVFDGTNADNYIDYQVLLLLDFGDGFFGGCGASLVAPNVVLR